MKINKKQYGKMLPEEVENIPWHSLCVDLIGKYQLAPKGERK